MKVLIAPDKFKRSLTANDACDHIDTGLKRHDPAMEIVKFPLTDGGEGALEVLGSVVNSEINYLEAWNQTGQYIGK